MPTLLERGKNIIKSIFSGYNNTRFYNVDFTGTSTSTNQVLSHSIKFKDLIEARAELEQGNTLLFSDLIEKMLETDYDVRSAFQDVIRSLQQSPIEVIAVSDTVSSSLISEQIGYVKEIISSLSYEGATGSDISAFIGAMFDLRGYSLFTVDYNESATSILSIKRVEPKRVRFSRQLTSYNVINDIQITDQNLNHLYSVKEINREYMEMFGVNAILVHRCSTIDTNKAIPLASIGLSLLPLSALTSTNLIEAQRILEFFGRPIAVAKMKTEALQFFNLSSDTGYNKKAEETLKLAIQRLGDLYGMVLPAGWEMVFEDAVGTGSVEAYLSMIRLFKEAKVELLTGSFLAKLGAKGGTNQQAELGEVYVNKAINFYGSQIESTLNKQLIEPLVKKVFGVCSVKVDVRTEATKNYQIEQAFLNNLRVPITYLEYSKSLGIKLPENVDPNELIMPRL